MGSAVKKTISLPPELAKEAEDTARAKGTTLSTVIQGALRLSRAARFAGLLEPNGQAERHHDREGSGALPQGVRIVFNFTDMY